MDIVQERLEREYGQSLITTALGGVRVKLRDGTVEQVSNPRGCRRWRRSRNSASRSWRAGSSCRRSTSAR